MMVSAVLALAMLGAQPPIEAVRSAEAQRITALLAADFATVERLLGSELNLRAPAKPPAPPELLIACNTGDRN